MWHLSIHIYGTTKELTESRNYSNAGLSVISCGRSLNNVTSTTDLSGRRGTGPPTEPGFSQGFFSILSPMEFSFLAAVASGLLSWGHLISSTIIDLIAQILFKLN